MNGSLTTVQEKAVQTLAGFGPTFFEHVVIPALSNGPVPEGADELAEIADSLDDPITALRVFFRSYAFARRGKDKHLLSECAVNALRNVVEHSSSAAFLASDDAAALWDEFERLCQTKGQRPMEQLNRGVIQGMGELAQEIYRIDGVGSLCNWVQRAQKLTPVFERIVDIRGVGPKSASCFLRDLVALYDQEDGVENVERLILQPVDRWVRQITLRYAFDDTDVDPVDWVIAGKASRLSRLAGVSGLDYNMGCSWFGQKIVRNPGQLESALISLEQA